MWKCNNDEEYPLRIKKRGGLERETRPGTRRELEEGGKTRALSQCFTRDAAKVWNQAPEAIKKSRTLQGAKKEIKAYCKTLPI